MTDPERPVIIDQIGGPHRTAFEPHARGRDSCRPGGRSDRGGAQSGPDTPPDAATAHQRRRRSACRPTVGRRNNRRTRNAVRNPQNDRHGASSTSRGCRVDRDRGSGTNGPWQRRSLATTLVIPWLTSPPATRSALLQSPDASEEPGCFSARAPDGGKRAGGGGTFRPQSITSRQGEGTRCT